MNHGYAANRIDEQGAYMNHGYAAYRIDEQGATP